MSGTPAFASTPRIGAVSIGTAETSRTAPTNTGTLFTAAAGGSVLAGIRFKAVATSTAGLLAVWLHDGSAYFLLKEIVVAAVTASGTVGAWEGTWVPDQAIVLPTASYSIRVSTYNAETFKAHTLLAGDL